MQVAERVRQQPIIVVQEEGGRPPREVQPMVARTRSFAVLQQPLHPEACLVEGAEPAGCVVVRCVVDDDELPVCKRLALNTGDRSGKSVPAVAGRDDDGDGRHPDRLRSTLRRS